MSWDPNRPSLRRASVPRSHFITEQEEAEGRGKSPTAASSQKTWWKFPGKGKRLHKMRVLAWPTPPPRVIELGHSWVWVAVSVGGTEQVWDILLGAHVSEQFNTRACGSWMCVRETERFLLLVNNKNNKSQKAIVWGRLGLLRQQFILV